MLWSDAALSMIKSQKHAVSVLVKRWPEDPPRIKELRDAGARIHYHQDYSTLRGRIVRRVAPKFSTTKVLDQVQPDFVVVSNGGNLPPVSLAECLPDKGIPFANVVHLNGPELFPRESAVCPLQRFVKAAVVNCFVAEEHAALLRRQLGIEIPNIRIVRNPVNIDLSHLPERLDNGLATMAFACVGRLQSGHKGQDLLLDVLAQDQWRSRNWHLSMFGNGPHLHAIKRMISLFGIADRVSLRGHVSDIREIWSNHHALVLPSRNEGMPLAILEAMAAGRPVIATDVGDVGRVVIDGETGFLAPAPTVQFIADALERAWSMREDWPRIGEQARDLALNFIPENAGAELLETISSGLEKNLDKLAR